MMKKIVFIAVAILIMSFGSMSYFSYLQSGVFKLPFAQLFSAQHSQGLSKASLENMTEKLQQVTETIPAAKSTKSQALIYKWQDANGQWQFGDKPPSDIQRVETVTVNNNQNVIDAVKIPVEEPPAPATASHVEPISKPNPYSPQQVKQLMDDAKNVQKLLDDRALQQQEILGGQ